MNLSRIDLTDDSAKLFHSNTVTWSMPLGEFRKIAAAWDRLGLAPFTGQAELLAKASQFYDDRYVKALDKAVFFDPADIIFEHLRFNFAGTNDMED